MTTKSLTPWLLVAACTLLPPARAAGQEHHPTASATEPLHRMWRAGIGAGWQVMGMAQAFPIVTFAAPDQQDSPLHLTEFYLTQPAVMANLESPQAALVLRTTLNFEGLTQPDGESTGGGWGEGFIDRRHPHTLLHEFMLSWNLPAFRAGALSLSAGKGFAPYGTDDPMARPALKYPTNHHLSQLLERWTVNAAYLRGEWSVEAGLFGGAEPEDPYDFGNIESFGDSWSARLAKRWSGDAGTGARAAWEASLSYGSVAEEHDGATERTTLYNAALRHSRTYGARDLYGLVEASASDPAAHAGYFSLLAEARLALAPHRPYLRLEYASRPEYPRAGAGGTDGFFRYDHDAAPIGTTRWLIATAGHGYELTGFPASVRPFVELQHHRMGAQGAGVPPAALFGTDTFWSVSAGARIFFGGDPMRMGSYGILDPMMTMHADHTGH